MVRYYNRREGLGCWFRFSCAFRKYRLCPGQNNKKSCLLAKNFLDGNSKGKGPKALRL